MENKEIFNFEIIRYRDKEDNPTCARNFYTQDVCVFYRTQRFGTEEVCCLTDNALKRRRKDNMGYLIPGVACPIWKK